MKKIVSLLLCLFVLSNLNAQQPEYTTIVRNASVFPGGQEAWMHYLQSNLNIGLGGRYIKIPKGQTTASQTVDLRFDVDTTGHTSHITVANAADVHPKLAEEAVRLIAASPVWTPAVENGRRVADMRRQKITFVNGSR